MTIFDDAYKINYSRSGAKVSSTNQTQGALSGAMKGAIVGGTVGGWPGAALGAVVGGTIGFVSGGKADKSNYYKQLAQAAQRQRALNANYNTLLQSIRKARQLRGDTLTAAGLTGTAASTKTLGALSSIGSQSIYSVDFMAEDLYLQDLTSRYLERAKANLQQAQENKNYFDLFITGFKTGSLFSEGFKGADGTFSTKQKKEGKDILNDSIDYV